MDEILKQLLGSSRHTLIIGRAGTGKSTLLNRFRQTCQKPKAVVAPTGVAALNVSGETIHSFFLLRPGGGEAEVRSSVRRLRKEKLKLYRALEVLVIDEISMVRADLFDQMSLFLQLARRSRLPFGGVRVLMFGDLLQLPPVTRPDEWREMSLIYNSPYFFASKTWQNMTGDLFGNELEVVELEKIYRQTETEFIDFLNQVREKKLQQGMIEEINRRLVDEAIDLTASEHKQAVVLATTNKKVDMINQMQMQQLSSQGQVFQAVKKGKFEPSSFPTEAELYLKKGARIMLVNNDSEKRWINGTMGWVEDFIEQEKTSEAGIVVKLDDGRVLEIWPNNWEMAKSTYDGEKDEIVREVVGNFRQLPVKLAWAMTIHKAQGKTFDQVIIDLDWSAFATGQTYVALSRCRSLGGMKLTRPLRESDVLIDGKIIDFLAQLKTESEKEMIL